MGAAAGGGGLRPPPRGCGSSGGGPLGGLERGWGAPSWALLRGSSGRLPSPEVGRGGSAAAAAFRFAGTPWALAPGTLVSGRSACSSSITLRATLGVISWPSQPMLTVLLELSVLMRCSVLGKGRFVIHSHVTGSASSISTMPEPEAHCVTPRSGRPLSWQYPWKASLPLTAKIRYTSPAAT